jgi:hypothetical protein
MLLGLPRVHPEVRLPAVAAALRAGDGTVRPVSLQTLFPFPVYRVNKGVLRQGKWLEFVDLLPEILSYALLRLKKQNKSAINV